MKKSFYYILAIIALLVYKLLPFIIVVAIIGLIIVKFEQDNKKISDNISGNISTKNIHDINYTKDYLDISKRQGEKLQAVVNELDKLDISEKNKVIHGIRSLQMEYWHKRKNIYISNLYDYILKFANIRLGDIKYDSSKKEYEMILQIVQMLNEESSIENVVGFVSLRNENTTTDNDNVTDDNTQKQLEKIPNKCYGVGEYIKTCTAEFENHEQKTYLNISVQNMFSNNVQPTIENNLKNSKKDRFEISEQQLEKIKEITKIYKDSKCIEIHKIIIQLLSFCSEYYSRNNKMVLYDYIIKAAYQRIKTAKRDYIKKECESVLQIRHGGERETQAHVLLNSIFVSFTSIFDILSKIAVEQFMFDQYDFTKYKEMHCKKERAMYKPNIKNIDPSLKQNGLLFTDPEVIRKFETFRNEYVHNGPWDLRSSVYYTAVNGEPADVIIYSPDIVDGHFVTSNSRNKFYSQNNRINEQLPDMIKEATQILMRTIDQISALYQQNTVRSENPKLTEEYMKAIADYYKSLI